MRLLGYGSCLVQDNIWFVELRYSYLFRYIREKKECELVCRLPVNGSDITPYSGTILCDDKIVCIPGSSDYIAIYDLNRRNLTNIPILPLVYENHIRKYRKTGAVDFAVKYNNNVIMFGNCCECIFILNILTEKVEVKNTLYKELRENKNDTTCLFRKDTAIRDDKIYLALFSDNKVVEYNLNTHLYRIIEIERESKGYIGICFDGVDFWLLEKGGWVIKWNSDSNKVKEMFVIPNFEGEAGGRFFYKNKKLYILKQSNEGYYIYDIAQNRMKKGEFRKAKIEKIPWARYPFVCEFKENFYISNMGWEIVEIYDQELNLIEEIEFTIKSSYIEEIWKDYMIESRETSLQDYLLHIETTKSKPVETHKCGEDIYKKIREME